MTKRVLIFSLAYHPRHIGGAEVAIHEITNRISKDDIEFHMVTLRFDSDLPKKEQIENVFVHRVGFGSSYISKILFVPMSAFYAWRLHKKEKFDAFWAMMTYMLFPISLLWLFGIKVPYVLTLQDGDPFETVFGRWYIKPFSFLLKYGFKNAKVVQVISKHLSGWAKDINSDCNIKVIPNGVDMDKFQNLFNKEELNKLKEKINKKEKDVFLITTSRLVHKNAIDDVIVAMKDLPENIHFIVLGKGIEEEKLKEIADKNGVSGRIKFLGHIAYEDIPKYLAVSDVFIRPSRSEGMGNSFIEAMAVGLPVVATQEGGIADFLFDEKKNPDKKPTGWAVRKDAPEDIVLAIKDILRNKDKVGLVKENAKDFIKGKYEWGVVANRMKKEIFDFITKND